MPAELPPYPEDHARSNRRQVILALESSLSRYYGESAWTALAVERDHYVSDLIGARSTFSEEERRDNLAAAFAVEAMDALTRVLPDLAERKAEIYRRAVEAPDVVAAWVELDPRYSTVPPIRPPSDHLAPGIQLQPEYLAGVLHPSAALLPMDATAGRYELWRSPGLYGIVVPLLGRTEESLRRFAPEVRDISRLVVDPAVIEQAYFTHLEREAHRAAFPFGISNPDVRDRIVMALSLELESESAGLAERALEESGFAPGMVATDAALLSGHAAILQRLHGGRKPLLETAERRPLHAFDAIRAAAMVQRWAAPGSPFRRAPSGWARVLEREGFAIPRPGTDASPAQASFVGRRLALLPYERATADRLAELWPAGARKTIARALKENPDTFSLGRLRDDQLVLAIRAELIDTFYRERVKNEQLGRPDQHKGTLLNSAQGALEDLLHQKVGQIRKRLARRPVDGTLQSLDAPQTRERVEAGAPDAGIPVWAERERASGLEQYLRAELRSAWSEPGESWSSEFARLMPGYLRAFRASLDRANSRISSLDERALDRLGSFLDWLASAEGRRAEVVDGNYARARVLWAAELMVPENRADARRWRDEQSTAVKRGVRLVLGRGWASMDREQLTEELPLFVRDALLADEEAPDPPSDAS